ncbi:MAG: glucosidase [Phycisphaeraceae bacterium]|nr:glucosidase [Phycisphaeraceae bacterium]
MAMHNGTTARPGGQAERKDPESVRLAEDGRREKNWKRWGPYLAERQWGTVREDYSEGGDCWNSFSHDQARSRAYRWGEDGLLGITDRECRLCFGLALWNGKDPILKERLFGLTGPEGNHGEDVKEEYFYLDSTPTHSYMKVLYKYPQAEFPYARLVHENRSRGRGEAEYELADTGVFAQSRYFDVQAEYAKAGPDDVLIRVTVSNRGPEPARIDVLPTLWFRNTWSWPTQGEAAGKPRLARAASQVVADHPTLGRFRLAVGTGPDGREPELLFTENESNAARLYGGTNTSGYAKDGFHERVVGGRESAVNPSGEGTKAAAWYRMEIPAGGRVSLRLRLCPESDAPARGVGEDFDSVFEQRLGEADEFYTGLGHDRLEPEQRAVARQAAAGLLWSKQFYYYVIKPWMTGDPGHPAPPESRKSGRNADWLHLYNRDIISMPDKWEYPWFAAWDLAFHMIPFARLDPQFAKEQLLLLLREWYMHPSGQIPAYEFAFGDVNPPVHAWACWRVYKMTGPHGGRDRVFLARAFHKLLLNFNWWVNRKDPSGKHLFAGGFLGLDNIGVFDRSQPLPTGGTLEQADGTAWMAFYCGTMLSIALELASEDPAYEDVASKFFEHFVAITDAINTVGGTGLWDEADGFYYDQIRLDGGRSIPLKVRSLVGMVPLLAVEVLENEVIDRLPGFKKRMQWFLDHRKDLPWNTTCACGHGGADRGHRLLAIPTRERLERVLSYLLDEGEFLSPYGVRSVSKVHERSPYVLGLGGREYRVDYTPGESTTGLFGGNSNWRGPIWFPLNFLILEALERYHHFYGDDLRVECPKGSGVMVNLGQAADLVRMRLVALFLPGDGGRRPCHGEEARFALDPHWRDLVLFHEHFHGDTGRGLGATHQTGWTALVLPMLESLVRERPGAAGRANESGAGAATVTTSRRARGVHAAT